MISFLFVEFGEYSGGSLSIHDNGGAYYFANHILFNMFNKHCLMVIGNSSSFQVLKVWF